MKKILLRYNLLWVLLFAMVFVPAILVRLKHAPYHRQNPILTALDGELVGMTNPVAKPPFDLTHIRSHEVQKYLEDKWTTNLPIHHWLVKLNNQIYYMLFKKSYNLNGQMVVGKANQLFELAYINAYCDYQHNLLEKKAELATWADKVKRISDYFTAHGKTFVYVITPSKAEYLPEAIPDRFHCHAPGTNILSREMQKLLIQRHVRVANTADLMAPATITYHTPMFPQGGTHWNYLAASIGANAIIDSINQHNKIALNPLNFHYDLNAKPAGTDEDLFSLLNLLQHSLYYTTPKVDYVLAKKPNKPLTAAFIGGSFCDQLIDAFLKSRTFKKIDFYRYFKLEHTSFVNANDPPLKIPIDLDKVASLDALLNADVVILEENVYLTNSNHGKLLFETLDKFGL